MRRKIQPDPLGSPSTHCSAPEPVSQMTSPIKIVVADDKAAVRLGIIQMLKTDTDLEVAGEATTFAETLELVDKPEARHRGAAELMLLQN